MSWQRRDIDAEFLATSAGLLGDDANTAGAGVVGKKLMAGREFRKLFERSYPAFAPVVRGFEQPGVAVVAVDRKRKKAAGVAFVAAHVGHPGAMILGRHTRSVLPLGRDRSMSLRHLAVIVEPVRSFQAGRGIRYRVIDLRSSHGLTTEEGEEVGAIRCDGPCFVAAGRYAFYLFVTGDPTDFCAGAGDAWACVPPRIYEDVRPRLARGSGRFQRIGLGPMSLGGELTTVQTLRPPSRLELGRLLGKGEAPVGELMVEGEDSLQRIEVGAGALGDGILIGRSERCDTGTAIDCRLLSRVHLLLLEVGGELYAFDTASTNGSYAAAANWIEFRVAHMPARATVNLAEAVAIRWRKRLTLGEGQ